MNALIPQEKSQISVVANARTSAPPDAQRPILNKINNSDQEKHVSVNKDDAEPPIRRDSRPRKPTEPQASQSIIIRTPAPRLVITNAMYGIPLGSSLEQVLRWCESKDLTVENPTKEEVKAEIEQISEFNKLLSKELQQAENWQTELEKAIERMGQGGTTSELLKKLMNEQAAVQVNEFLGVLRSPSFSYKGTRYLLPSFAGRSILVHGRTSVDLPVGCYAENLCNLGDQGMKRHLCDDTRITKSSYNLLILPSGKLQNEDLRAIVVSFFKDTDGKLWSYSAAANYHGELSTMHEKSRKIRETLNEKYGADRMTDYGHGNRSFMVAFGERKVLDPAIGSVNYFFLTFKPEFRVHDLDCRFPFCVWDNQIILGHYYGGKPFFLMYMNPAFADRLRALHEQALVDCARNYNESQRAEKKKMQSDF